LIFTDRHGRLIGDNNDDEIPGVDIVEIPGVDIVELPGVDVAEDPAPQIVEIDDLDMPTPDLPPVEVETAAPVEPAPVRNDTKLVQDTAAPVETAPDAQPAEPQGARRSARIRTLTRAYEPAVIQWESQGVLNPDAHMFVQEDFCLKGGQTDKGHC
jgi:hypothetical protein